MHKLMVIFICASLSFSVKANVLFLGDFSLGEGYQSKLNPNLLSKHGADYFFIHLAPFLQNSEQTVVNFESVITQAIKSPFEKTKDWLHFDRPQKILPVLLKYKLTNLSLANNHSIDFSHTGLRDTLEILQKNKFKFFGAGLNESEALKPLHLKERERDIYIYGAFEFRRSYEKKFSAYAKNNSPGTQSLDSPAFFSRIQANKKNFPKAIHIAFIHWGKNYKFKVSTKQKKIATKLIDAGIDLIIGHGAHTIQTVEQINGKWIFYNIGNSVFPSPGRYAKNKAYPYSLMVNLENNELKIYPIISDNKLTNYQAQFPDQIMIEKIKDILFAPKTPLNTHKDKYGSYFQIKL